MTFMRILVQAAYGVAEYLSLYQSENGSGYPCRHRTTDAAGQTP